MLGGIIGRDVNGRRQCIGAKLSGQRLQGLLSAGGKAHLPAIGEQPTGHLKSDARAGPNHNRFSFHAANLRKKGRKQAFLSDINIPSCGMPRYFFCADRPAV